MSLINDRNLWCPNCDVSIDSQRVEIDSCGWLKCSTCHDFVRNKEEVDKVRRSMRYRLRNLWRKLAKSN